MTFLDFTDYPLWINIAVFAVSAAVVWVSGTRLARYADTISRRTGIGQAVTGLLLLGGITSLPEIAVTGTSAFTGNAALAVNNILGGVAMQVAILAAADAAIGRDALTRSLPIPCSCCNAPCAPCCSPWSPQQSPSVMFCSLASVPGHGASSRSSSCR